MVLDTILDVKGFYRFIEFVSKLLKYDVTHEKTKQIVLDNAKAISKTERQIKDFSDAFLYACNNARQLMTKDKLNKIYLLLNNENLSNEVAEQLLNLYYKEYDNSPFYVAACIHLLVLRTNIKRKFEYAFIMSNLVLLTRRRNIIIPYEYISQSYFNAIKNNNVDKLTQIFIKSEHHNVLPKELIDVKLEDIIKVIKEQKQFLKNVYYVEKLYLYGSFAKETNHKNSDLDFLVIFNESMINLERKINLNKIKEYLYKFLRVKIDLIDFTHALNNLEIYEMEKIITLI